MGIIIFFVNNAMVVSRWFVGGIWVDGWWIVNSFGVGAEWFGRGSDSLRGIVGGEGFLSTQTQCMIRRIQGV